ncbi:hypothetical protein PHLCEN_2v8557 [Hermanssonia centrifuga]|uniref:Protein kinase domain-containing protein n=1 Tax=Hermanssonia centrifuga TaxID=98765 RepID=A0A2R6NTG2_9APHY|nr:hypothetical protein PHLCEN_2v8557 [Hermanssonia centrifuga]
MPPVVLQDTEALPPEDLTKLLFEPGLYRGVEGSHPRVNMASTLVTAHNNDSVHPYVKEDLIYSTQDIPYNRWLNAVFNLSPQKVDAWVAHIIRFKWFQDAIIQKALYRYSMAGDEHTLYDPFVCLAKRILELARATKLPELDGTFPIHDIELVSTYKKMVRTIPEHDGLGARRYPDLLLLRAVHAKKIPPQGKKAASGILWADILAFFEVKYSATDTADMPSLFKSTLENRGMKFPPTFKPTKSQQTPEPSTTTSNRKAGSGRVHTDATHDSSSEESASEAGTLSRNEDQAPRAATKRARSSKSSDTTLHGTRSKKSTSSQASVDGRVQAGGYALEVMSCSYGTRLFCLGNIIKDDKMSMWYYDASGYIRTRETLSIFEDFEKVAAVLVAFASCTPSQFGAMPSIIKPPSSAPYPRSFPPASLQGHTLTIKHPETSENIHVTLEDPIFAQYVLVGRRTFLYGIRTSPVQRKKLIIKFSYQVRARQAEQELVKKACSAGVEHLPEIHFWADLWQMSDGVRKLFYEDEKELPFQDRTLRAIVYTRYTPIVELFSKSCEFLPLMVDQMLDCLHDLRYKANILHRDVSKNNIMYEMRDNRPQFILIDYDLAKEVIGLDAFRRSSTGKHRTGTLPFMAYELVKDIARYGEPGHVPVVHRLRYDFESLFWVALWCAVKMPPSRDASEDNKLHNVVKEWESGLLTMLASHKRTLCTTPDEVNSLRLPPNSEYLRPWFRSWCEVMKKADLRLEEYKEALKKPSRLLPFDMETVDGLLTRDTIKEALAGSHICYTLEQLVELQETDEVEHAVTNGPYDEESNDYQQARRCCSLSWFLDWCWPELANYPLALDTIPSAVD